MWQPSDLASGRLLAFENFYYTGQMLGVPRPDASPRDFGTAATEPAPCPGARCKSSDIPRDGSGKEETNKLCFSATYLDLFLEKGVGVAPASTVKVMQQVGEHGIDGRSARRSRRVVAERRRGLIFGVSSSRSSF